MNVRPLPYQQGAPEYKPPVQARLRRSAACGQCGRARLTGPAGCCPLPFRSQIRTPLRCAVGGSRTRTSGATATRFPTLLAWVHRQPPQSVSCANMSFMATGERPRTGVNETQTEPRPGSRTHRVARFRGLGSAIPHWPPTCLTWAEWTPAFPGEPLRTGVNETTTETRPRRASRLPRGAR